MLPEKDLELNLEKALLGPLAPELAMQLQKVHSMSARMQAAKDKRELRAPYVGVENTPFTAFDGAVEHYVRTREKLDAHSTQ